MTRMIMASCGRPGCIEDSYAVDILDPTLIRISERWVRRSLLQLMSELLNCVDLDSTPKCRRERLLQYPELTRPTDTREKFFRVTGGWRGLAPFGWATERDWMPKR